MKQENVPNPTKHRIQDNIVVGTCNFLLNVFASKEYLQMFRTCVGLGLSAMDDLLIQKEKEDRLAEAMETHKSYTVQSATLLGVVDAPTPNINCCKFDSNPVIPGTKLCENHRYPPGFPKPAPYTKEMHEAGNKLLLWLDEVKPDSFIPQFEAYTFLANQGITWLQSTEVMHVLKNMELIAFSPDGANIRTTEQEGNNN